MGESTYLASQKGKMVAAHFEEAQSGGCSVWFYVRYYRVVLAMVFAIEEINQNPHFLPNITLGFRIFDSCISEMKAIRGALELLSGKKGPIPGYSCPARPLLAGIIGETLSSLTVPMARIMGVLHYPQISHSAAIATLSDKLQFPSFLRTVPGNTFQNMALAQLIGHFGWTWVGMIISDDEVGLQGGQYVKKLIEDNGGCVAFLERIHLRYSKEKVLRVFDLIQGHSVQVVIIHSAEAHVKMLLETLYTQNVTGKNWVFSAYFGISPGFFEHQAWKIMNGTLGLKPYTDTISGFEEFLYNLHPKTFPEDIFLKRFWGKAFQCQWLDGNKATNLGAEELKPCSGNETLEKKAISLFELDDLSYTYHCYLAVHAFAHALKSLISCTAGQGPCREIKDIRPWQILHNLRNVHFTTRSGHEISFDANGDAPATFDILNIQISQDGEFHLIKVGKIDPKAPEGNKVTVNVSGILWHGGSSEVPHSVCSDSCPPGFRKAAREGEPVCCYDCIPCSHGEISIKKDAVTCLKCPVMEWSNERHDQCVKKLIDFLSYEEPLGLILAIAASLVALLAASILCIFIKHRDTAIVKASNRGLSSFLLLSLMLCFLCSFIFIGHPRKLTCMLRQTVFGVIFSISVSAVLAKTIIVVVAFKAKNPSSSTRKYLGSKIPRCVVFFCSLVQVLICAVWIMTSPPFPEIDFKSYNEKVIFACNEGDTIFFYCMLGYMGLLATVSFILAFLSRNLPGSFNEAKLITFSMLVFVSVWISFIPAYLSTRGKYMVAVEVFAILCSSAGLLVCIFLPKCYIILVRPERNTKQHLVGKSQFASKKKE
ncbi:extracellular calcium-sensing receptor-like [Ambystoma mexicanum]|uniref:extracellular calcium-sensing receptor-like n=1 Tax=Ambystoma mexicanum TaxID=8296 RepID=UPI0037E8788A